MPKYKEKSARIYTRAEMIVINNPLPSSKVEPLRCALTKRLPLFTMTVRLRLKQEFQIVEFVSKELTAIIRQSSLIWWTPTTT